MQFGGFLLRYILSLLVYIIIGCISYLRFSSGQAKMEHPFWQQELATGPVLATAGKWTGSWAYQGLKWLLEPLEDNFL